MVEIFLTEGFHSCERNLELNWLLYLISTGVALERLLFKIAVSGIFGLVQ